jgi:hypothetical protein
MYLSLACRGGRSVIAAGRLRQGMEQASVSNTSNIVRHVNVGLCAMSSLGEICMFCMNSVVQASFTFRPPNKAGRTVKVVICVIKSNPRFGLLSDYQLKKYIRTCLEGCF